MLYGVDCPSAGHGFKLKKYIKKSELDFIDVEFEIVLSANEPMLFEMVEAVFRKRIAKLEKRINESSLYVKMAASEALDFAKSNDFEKANAQLDIVVKLLKDLYVYRKKLALFRDEVQKVGGEAKLQFSQAAVAINKGEYNKADTLLSNLQLLLGTTEDGEPTLEEPINWTVFEDEWVDIKKGWNAAIEDIDGQIGRLQGRLRTSGITLLEEIADKSLTTITDKHKVPLMVAFNEIDGSRDDLKAKARAVKKAAKAVKKFRKHITNPKTAARIESLEEDADLFGIGKLVIGSKLTAALNDLNDGLTPYLAA